jgi:murein DD-endopeptidase MepM/ murein hydrolase activator NlpD
MMKSKYLSRVVSLLVLFVSLLPASSAGAIAPMAPPPLDMFQLPWDQGIAWVAIDGIDNGTKRPASSSHNYRLGGAIDFAPKSKMTTGENTSNFWVTAAAAGVVVEKSSCHLSIAHDNGWLTQYQFLGNIQVNLGDSVARNQRLAIIADGVKYKYCPGYEEINVPHLHFMLRPSIIGASFAGWEVKYSSLFNRTTFAKGLITVGLFQPLLNVFDSAPTPTPTALPTNTPGNLPSPTPTLSGPYVSTAINPRDINLGETALVTVSLNNVPVEGYTSAEFTCAYNANLFEVSNINITTLFGADPVVAINGPQAQRLIVAIAGSKGNKATISGAAFTFDVLGSQVGQTVIECRARVSQGNNALSEIPFVVDYLTILGSTPTPNLTPSHTPTPTPSPAPFTPVPTESPASATPTGPSTVCNKAEFIRDLTLPPGTVVSPGSILAKGWRIQNVGSCTWTPPAYAWVFFSGERMDAPLSWTFNENVLPGQMVDVYISFVAPMTSGHHQGFWKISNATGGLFGKGDSANDPFLLDIVVSGPTATPIANSTTTPVPSDWLTFTNTAYAFEFRYPPQGIIASGQTDTFARIDLPILQPGTNLREKYLEVIVQENANPCQSPLATQSILESSQIVTLNSITFLKQTGGDAGAGNVYQWVAYSTSRNNVCVSLDFILHSINPGVFSTPPPLFDYAAETAVFDQIASTYAWLGLSSTATPTASQVSTLAPTSTPVFTATPTVFMSPTPSGGNGAIAGQVTASKSVVINVYDSSTTLVATLQTQPDGSFQLEVAPGNYTVVASAPGFLQAQAGVPSLNAGVTRILPPITLLAGDIDNNNVVDQFDALTIGMSYNTASPAAADLNDDGIINVLDLELLAGNYRKTGPLVWE